ncbi:hypothetical protein BDW74DRAFT_27034 [Aspergillus multicolor]|uniref:uncharacterized protein n=1 Tax=Aspergillus multicolor TaxID=41759 RepID=UPI003CCE323B
MRRARIRTQESGKWPAESRPGPSLLLGSGLDLERPGSSSTWRLDRSRSRRRTERLLAIAPTPSLLGLRRRAQQPGGLGVGGTFVVGVHAAAYPVQDSRLGKVLDMAVLWLVVRNLHTAYVVCCMLYLRGLI